MPVPPFSIRRAARGLLVVAQLTEFNTVPALASCKDVGVQFKQAEAGIATTMENYERLARELASSRQAVAVMDRALAAAKNLARGYDNWIVALEAAKAQGCLTGRYGYQYLNLLDQFKKKREEFQSEIITIEQNRTSIMKYLNSANNAGMTPAENINLIIDKNIKAINDSTPLVVDSKTTLIKVERVGNVINYYLKLAIIGDTFPKKFLVKELQSGAIKRICDDAVLAGIVAQGFEYTHFYQDSSGLFVGTSNVSKKSCEDYTAAKITHKENVPPP